MDVSSLDHQWLTLLRFVCCCIYVAIIIATLQVNVTYCSSDVIISLGRSI